MKNLILLMSVMTSASAFANPFANFAGNYSLVGTPQVQMSAEMKYCDWQGFREMTGVSLSLKNGNYESDLSTKIDNSDVHSYTAFQEYSYTGDFATNTAKISGDDKAATYQVINSGSGWMESTSWTISKNGSAYHLRQTWQSSHNSPTVNSCIYDAELIKQ